VVNKGSLCVKGRFGYDFIHHKDRLTTPLIKENGSFREASWNEALGMVASRLGEIKNTYGPDSIGGLSSARCTNEENYLFQKFFRAGVGTNNVDHCARY
jgi:predicted molibdopterin-dependent oxidoreductase YjgC